MLVKKINRNLILQFQQIVRKNQGFMCILSSPNIEAGFVSSPELERFCRRQEQDLRQLHETKATLIQTHIRILLAKAELKRRIDYRDWCIKNAAATEIQRYYRRWSAKRFSKLLWYMREIAYRRELACAYIQQRYRTFRLKQKLHFMSTVGKLFKIRNQAATFIQKYVKGCLARKDLKFLNKPRRNLLVRWRYNAREVFIIGDFTTPQWSTLIPMIYSKNLREFYSTYFMDKILLPGKYRLKFIVDSIWTCDGNLPIGEDDKGNYNNIIKITSNDVKQGKKAESRDIKLIKNKVFQLIKMEELTDAQTQEFREAFKMFDKDNDGFITIRELGTAMRAMGQNPTDIELQEMLDEVDTDKNNAIDFNEFVTMMCKSIHDLETEEKTLEAFRVFDRYGSRVIRASELKNIMMTLGESMSEDEVDELIKLANQDEGMIDYEEFVRSIFGSAS